MSNSNLILGGRKLSVVFRSLSIGKSKSVTAKDLPKRPPNPWATFYANNVGDCKKANPALKNADIMRKIGEDWKKVPENKKSAMKAVFEKEMVKYQKQMATIPADQIEAIARQKKTDKAEKNISAAKGELKEMLDRMKRPKRPYNSYFLYTSERAKDLPASLLAKPAPVRAAHLGTEWEKMSVHQKSVFEKKAAELKVNHVKAMDKWNKKMEREGKTMHIQFAKFMISEMYKKKAAAGSQTL